jgi:EAL domain-containing protein (putative c-di-GMP-specific phosphodiesterase class I)
MIETDQVWQERMALRCEIGQGYMIARPMPGNCFHAVITDWLDQAVS